MMSTSTKPLALAVLISGNGSNLQAIIDAIKQQRLTAEIKVVISNCADAYGLERARAAQIPTEVLLNSDYSDRAAYDEALLKVLTPYQPELIVLAGFMRILSSEFINHYCGKILNIHPSLLPKYPGLHTHAKALAAGDTLHGITIHFVDEGLDSGPIILQAALPILSNDTTDSLRERVQKLEHQVYPVVIQWIAEQKLQHKQDGIWLNGLPLPQTGYQWQGN